MADKEWQEKWLQDRIREYDDLFELQLGRLCFRHYPDAIGIGEHFFVNGMRQLKLFFLENKDLILALSSQEGQNKIPFLVVIPESLLSIPQMMKLCMVGGVPGHLSSFDLRNRYVSIRMSDPTAPYLITGLAIEQGIKDPAERYKSLETFQDFYQKTKASNRHFLNASEGVSFVTQYPNLVRERRVFLGNATHTTERGIPLISYLPRNTAGETCTLSSLGIPDAKLDSECDLIVSYENRVVLS